jgi:hypothetical protein
MNTLDKIKDIYFRANTNWGVLKLTFGVCNVQQIVTTLQRFAPYLLSAYDCFFVENECGVAVVTCVSEQGIRVVYFTGQKTGSYEWLHFTGGAIRGDADSLRTMVKQPERN